MKRLDGENIIIPPTAFAIVRIRAIANFWWEFYSSE
jgi:hypothetical protein